MINSKTFNAWIKLLIRNLKKKISDDINNNIEKNYNYKTLPLNEVEDEIKENKEKIIKSDNKIDINDVKGNDEIKDNIYFLWKSVIMKNIIMKLNKIQKNKKYIQYIILE